MGHIGKSALGILFGILAYPVAAGAAPAEASSPSDATTAGVPTGSQFIAAAQTSYGRFLSDMRDSYTARMPRNIPIGVVDPDSFTALTGAGMDLNTTIRFILQRQGVKMDGATGLQLGLRMIGGESPYAQSIKDLLADETRPVPRASMISPYSYRLAAAEADPSAGPGCSILPASFTPSPYMFEGLTFEQNILFINRHEFWHCMDNSADRMAGPREAFADLGALTDMILLDGAPLDIIDKIAESRRLYLDYEGNIDHFSTFALQALRREIDAMGLERFRQMEERERLSLLRRLVRDNTLSTRESRLFERYFARQLSETDLAEATSPKSRDKIERYSNAFSMRKLFRAQQAPVAFGEKALAELAAYDAEGLLRTGAQRNGRMTMLGLVSARTALVEDLRRQVLRTPGDLLLGAKLAKVDVAFSLLMTDRANFAAPAAGVMKASLKPEKLHAPGKNFPAL